MSNIAKRILLALILIPSFLFVLYLGGFYLLALTIVMNIGLSFEFHKILRIKKLNAPLPVFLGISILFPVGIMLNYDIVFLTIASFIFLSIYEIIFTKATRNAINRLAYNILFIYFIPFSTSFLLSIFKSYQADMQYFKYFLYMFTLIWVCDSFAYFTGMLFGSRHRNVTIISPKKSLEGFIGGFLFTVTTSMIFTKFVLNHTDIFPGLYTGIVMGIVVQFGDLFESLIKRDVQIKDSSALIPGHGGLLDRLDSTLFVLPIFYYILGYIIS